MKIDASLGFRAHHTVSQIREVVCGMTYREVESWIAAEADEMIFVVVVDTEKLDALKQRCAELDVAISTGGSDE